MRLYQTRPEALCSNAPAARHVINSHDQQWLTAQVLSHSEIPVDDVWVRYVALGGIADAVAIAAYLHGHLILDTMQRDLITHAINELLSEADNTTDNHPGDRPEVELPGLRSSGGSGSDAITDSEFERIMMGQDAAQDQANSSRFPAFRAPYDHEPAGTPLLALNEAGQPQADVGLARPGVSWPPLQTRLVSMFNPAEAENRRLEALRVTRLFDSAPEERFDRITREAQQTFGTSSATISFIGRDRQFVKSSTGPLGTDVPRDKSFCSHTIAEDRTLVIPDATIDSRFVDNLLVSETPRIRFYAGHPLTGPGGWRIGALCILDTEPRSFSEEDRRKLRILAGLTQMEIINA